MVLYTRSIINQSGLFYKIIILKRLLCALAELIYWPSSDQSRGIINNYACRPKWVLIITKYGDRRGHESSSLNRNILQLFFVLKYTSASGRTVTLITGLLTVFQCEKRWSRTITINGLCMQITVITACYNDRVMAASQRCAARKVHWIRVVKWGKNLINPHREHRESIESSQA